MLKDIYNKYKLIYKDYVILIKNGNFYLGINDDSIVLNNIFKFKITESKNFLKCGFPLDSIYKVIDTLGELNINYLIIDNDITDKKKYTTNNYLKYTNKSNYILLKKIDNINNILRLNINNIYINKIINDIEGILCRISY